MKRRKELLFTGIFLFFIVALLISCDSPTKTSSGDIATVEVQFFEYEETLDRWRAAILVTAPVSLLPVDVSADMYVNCGDGNNNYDTKVIEAKQSDMTYIIDTHVRERFNRLQCSAHWVEFSWSDDAGNHTVSTEKKNP